MRPDDCCFHPCLCSPAIRHGLINYLARPNRKHRLAAAAFCVFRCAGTRRGTAVQRSAKMLKPVSDFLLEFHFIASPNSVHFFSRQFNIGMCAAQWLPCSIHVNIGLKMVFRHIQTSHVHKLSDAYHLIHSIPLKQLGCLGWFVYFFASFPAFLREGSNALEWSGRREGVFARWHTSPLTHDQPTQNVSPQPSELNF